MMNWRIVGLGLALGFAVAVVPSCGGSKCTPATCGGCCGADGKCVVKTNNANNTTCGAQGNACVDCTKTQQACSATTFTCNAISTGGGSGGGDTGGGAGGGGGVTCSGCKLPNGTCIELQNTTTMNCGTAGNACQLCASGQLCTAGVCTTQASTVKVGDACINNADCTGAGTGVVCRQATTSGNASYTGGYCTKTCGSSTSDTCPTGSTCISGLSSFGEAANLCLSNCGTATTACRSSGYACYTAGDTLKICWLAPLPSLPTNTHVGEACTANTSCGTAANNDVCETRDDRFFPQGYCTRNNCASNADCLGGDGGICLTTSNTASSCVKRCAVGGSPEDGGATQSDCRSGYLCTSYLRTLTDGGLLESSDGYCYPPPAPFPNNTGGACGVDTDCQVPTGAVADCIPGADDAGMTGFTGGYCTRFDCQSNEECGSGPTSDAGICLTLGTAPNTTNECFINCAHPTTGQDTCRTGFVCEGYTLGLADGGTMPSVDGFCFPNCNNAGGGCATGQTCASTGYCQ